MDATQALPNPICPLCGGPNACAPATSGDLNTPCWCREAVFSAALLAKVPQAQQGCACICAKCAAQDAAASGIETQAPPNKPKA